MPNRIITGGLTSNANEPSTIVQIFPEGTREVLYQGKSAGINEEVIRNIETRLASCRLTGVKLLRRSNDVWEEDFKDVLCIMGGEPEVQLRIAELAWDKMEVDMTELQTTYSSLHVNEGLDETPRITNTDIYDDLDKDSRASSSGQRTPKSGEISVHELFDDYEPPHVLSPGNAGEHDTLDSLPPKSTSGSDNETSADKIVDSTQRSAHFESDPECDIRPSGPSTMIITGDRNEVRGVNQGHGGFLFVGSGMSRDLIEALLARSV